VTRHENEEKKSRAALRNQILRQTYRKIRQKLKKLKRDYGENALPRAHVFSRHKAFLDGRENVKMNLALEDIVRQKQTKM
jgi:hypothetical protein